MGGASAPTLPLSSRWSPGAVGAVECPPPTTRSPSPPGPLAGTAREWKVGGVSWGEPGGWIYGFRLALPDRLELPDKSPRLTTVQISRQTDRYTLAQLRKL